MIAKLYEVEKIARENNYTYAERHILRKEKSSPILSELKEWLANHVGKVPPNSKLGDAFTYALNQWPYLVTYLNDGRYEIDNNDLENLIRPFAVGRRNWMFMGSPAGAEAGALFYSLIAVAKAQGLNPFEYLRYVFTHIRECSRIDDYRSLLPHALTPEIIKLS